MGASCTSARPAPTPCRCSRSRRSSASGACRPAATRPTCRPRAAAGPGSCGCRPRASASGPTRTAPTPSTPRRWTRPTPSRSSCRGSRFGDTGIGALPSARALKALTAQADAQLRPANLPGRAPGGTPIAPNGPIKYVFYIVRENRTYDQVLGDDARGDGDPTLTLFGADDDAQPPRPRDALPAARPRLRRLRGLPAGPLQWTAAANINDHTEKAWNQVSSPFADYGARGRPLETGFLAVTLPAARLPLRPGAAPERVVLQLRRGLRRRHPAALQGAADPGQHGGQGPHAAGRRRGAGQVPAVGLRPADRVRLLPQRRCTSTPTRSPASASSTRRCRPTRPTARSRAPTASAATWPSSSRRATCRASTTSP